jgi:hypothetical protein
MPAKGCTCLFHHSKDSRVTDLLVEVGLGANISALAADNPLTKKRRCAEFAFP